MFSAVEVPKAVEAPKRDLVVVVDDDPPILSAVARLLRREPYDVVTTVDPEEVLARVRRQDVRLVIADQRMPALRGTELLKAVRQLSPRTACVILTGHADLSEVAGAMNEGAVHRLIKKPWDDREFREEIRRLLRDRAPESAATPPAGESRPALPERTVARVDCRGKTMVEIHTALWGVVDPPERKPLRSAIVLEHLREFPGSVYALLTTLVRRVLHSGLRTALVEESGLVEAFVGLAGRFLPIVTFVREADLPAPRRILVVEDQPEGLHFLRTVIESAGHAIDAVRTVGQAIAKIDAEPFEVILLDLVPPGADGLDVARHLLERGLRIPIIAASADPGRLEIATEQTPAIRCQIRKPYRARDIVEAVRKARSKEGERA